MDRLPITLQPAWMAALRRALALMALTALMVGAGLGCGPGASESNNAPANTNATPIGANQEPPEVDDRPGTITVCNLTPDARTLVVDGGAPVDLEPWAVYEHDLAAGEHTFQVLPAAADATSSDTLSTKIQPGCQYYWDLSGSRQFSIITYRVLGGSLIEFVRDDPVRLNAQVALTDLAFTTQLGLLDPMPDSFAAEAGSTELSKVEMTDRWIVDQALTQPEDWPDPGFAERALFHDHTAYSPRELVALLVSLPDSLQDRRAEAALTLLRSGEPRVVDAVSETYLVEYPCPELHEPLRNLLGPDLRGEGESPLFARAAVRTLARSMLQEDLAQLWRDTDPKRRRFLFDSIKGIPGYTVARLYTDLVTRDLDAGAAGGPSRDYFVLEAAVEVMQLGYLQYTSVFRRLRDHFTARLDEIPLQEFAARKQALEALAQLYDMGLKAAKMRIANGDPIPYADLATLCRGALQLPNEYRDAVDVGLEAWRVAIDLLAEDYDQALPIFIEDWPSIKNTATRRDIIFRVREASARSRLIEMTNPDLLRLYRLGVVETEPDTRRWAFNGLALASNMADESLRELLRGVITVETDETRKRELTARYETAWVRYLAAQSWETAAGPLFELITRGQIGSETSENPGALAYHVALGRMKAAAGDDADALAAMRETWLQRLLDALPSIGETNRAALIFNLARDLPDEQGFTLAMGALADESAIVREVAGTVLLENAGWASRDGVEAAVAEAANTGGSDGDNAALRGRLAELEIARLEPLASAGDADALDALAGYLPSELPGVADRAVIAFRFLVHVDGAGDRVGTAFTDLPSDELKREVLSFASEFHAVPWAIFEVALAADDVVMRRAAAFGLVGLARNGNPQAQQLLHDAAEVESDPDLKTLMGQW